MTMHNPFFDADQMSLAELRTRIEADHELSVYKRRDIASACRSLAEWFHLPETSIPASAPYIREKLERVHPTERVKRYIDDWRMMFTPGASPYLFPGRKGAAKDCSALRKLITNTLWSHAAIRLTPHQFRHAAAKLLLDRMPGHYEVVRKLLGHKALTTTYAHYAGAETQKAIELYGEVITKARRDSVAQAFTEQKQNPKRHEDLFMDPLALMGKPKGRAS